MYFASAIMFLATAVRSCRAFVPRAGLTMAPVRAPVRMFSGIEMRERGVSDSPVSAGAGPPPRRPAAPKSSGASAATPATPQVRREEVRHGQVARAGASSDVVAVPSARAAAARPRPRAARRSGAPSPPAPPPRPARLQQLTATSPRFNTVKGYGFITPDNGGGDVFVHQTQIYARGFRSLAEGENVEFEIEMDQNGRERAVSVTGPEGDYVQGAPRPEPRYEDSY